MLICPVLFEVTVYIIAATYLLAVVIIVIKLKSLASIGFSGNASMFFIRSETIILRMSM